MSYYNSLKITVYSLQIHEVETSVWGGILFFNQMSHKIIQTLRNCLYTLHVNAMVKVLAVHQFN